MPLIAWLPFGCEAADEAGCMAEPFCPVAGEAEAADPRVAEEVPAGPCPALDAAAAVAASTEAVCTGRIMGEPLVPGERLGRENAKKREIIKGTYNE